MPQLFIKITQSFNASFVGLFLIVSLTSCGGSSSDSNSQSGSTQHNLSQSHHQGVAQKGPFATNSTVTITPLGLLGKPTAQSINTKIDGLSGSFSFDAPPEWKNESDSPLYEIKISGNYFDESSGNISNHSIQLTSVITDFAQNSVNLLTHWQAARIKVLLLQGKNPQQSIQTSEAELTDIFGIKNTHLLNIVQTRQFSSDNSMLLLLSGSLMDVAMQKHTEPQTIIDTMAADFSNDGELNDSGNAWFKRIQANIMSHPVTQTNLYSTRLKKHIKSNNTVGGGSLPANIRLASRPSAIVFSEIHGAPGETITLDARESHDQGSNNITYTWFRVDQNTAHDIPFSNKFTANPTITLPNTEIDLLFVVVVTDSQQFTDTAVTKVIVKNTINTNNAPVATPQPNITTREGIPINIILSGTDPDGDTITNYTIANTPIVLTHGSVDINGSLPNLKYTPSANAFGTDSFTFTVFDGDKASDPATIVITITPVNDAPVATSQTITTNEDNTKSITLAGTDIEGSPLSFTITSSPVHGVLTGTMPNLTYAPNEDYHRETSNTNSFEQFSFTVSDGELTSNTANVEITVVPISDGSPTASFFVAFPPNVNTPVDIQETLFSTNVTLHLDGSGSTDPDDFESGSGGNYVDYDDLILYSWKVNGAGLSLDGATDNSYTGSTIEIQPTSPGEVTITLTVTDSTGNQHSKTHTITVYDEGFLG